MFSMSICLISFLFLFIFSFICFNLGLYCLMNEISYFLEFELFSVNSCLVVMTFLIDWMSCFFLFIVTFISSLVIFYSKDYMSGEKFINRFIMLVLMFVLSMIFLIISPNLISILLGWDGLGLVSYCLVIYYQNIKSFNAGMLTALSNRIGDVLILMSIAWMLNFGSWNYIFYLEIMNLNYESMLIGVMLIMAAMTKSAQIPFSAWLPAAMAAPTPVSALVHSSTLVTAGVYLLIRFNLLIADSFFLKILLLLGGLTMFMSGLGASFEFDLKKIIALSTLSQLGLMMSILGMGFSYLAFFHLLTHALFKAMLFMCAGVLIHNMKNFQDIRYMGSLVNQMPLTITNFNVANLALCGFPFMAGFYSKDIILEMASFSFINMLIYFLFFFSTGLTVCYSLRLMYYSMNSNYSSWSFHSLGEVSFFMIFGMTGLMIMTIIGGSTLSWLIFPSPYLPILPFLMKILTLIVCISGGLLGYLFSKWSLYIKSKILSFKFISWFTGSMWFLPFISTICLTKYPLNLGGEYLKIMDMGWSEMLGGQNLYKIFSMFSVYLQIIHNNNLKLYLMLFFLWTVAIFFMAF